MDASPVYIAISGDTAWVRVDGRGTFLNSHPVKNWLLARMEEGHTRFIIELSNCKSMDSTFMGAVTGISLRMKRLGRAPVTLANITAHNKRLLETLGLDKFLILEEKFEVDSSLEWKLLPVESMDKLTTTRHMMEAHKELMGTGGVAQEQFKEVHGLLKEDMEEQLKKEKEEREKKDDG